MGSDWLEVLAAQLKDLDKVFVDLDKIANNRMSLSTEQAEELGDLGHPDVTHQYARILSRIIEALEKRPEFADGSGLRALRTLRLDLTALDEGNQPKRLAPRKGVSMGEANIGKRMYQAHVVLCVRLLEEIGTPPTLALTLVAQIFSDAGHLGQQGNGLSSSTINRWRDLFSADPDEGHRAGKKMIDSDLHRFRSNPSWPPSSEEALEFIKRRAASSEISLASTT